jgi:hypothetical protein
MSLPTGSENTGRNKSHVEMDADARPSGALPPLETELPVAGTFGNPASLGGFSPSPNRSAQQTSTEQGLSSGVPCPSGIRR